MVISQLGQGPHVQHFDCRPARWHFLSEDRVPGPPGSTATPDRSLGPLALSSPLLRNNLPALSKPKRDQIGLPRRENTGGRTQRSYLLVRPSRQRAWTLAR